MDVLLFKMAENEAVIISSDNSALEIEGSNSEDKGVVQVSLDSWSSFLEAAVDNEKEEFGKSEDEFMELFVNDFLCEESSNNSVTPPAMTLPTCKIEDNNSSKQVALIPSFCLL
eukprot:Gb_37976 [translate_table: standard]